MKRYRRHKLQKKRRLRQASGTSTYYHHSQRRRDRRRTAATATTYNHPSTSDVNVPSNRATGTVARTSISETDDDARSDLSERINRLVREVSRDSENPRVNHENLTGARQDEAGIEVINLTPPRAPGPSGRHIPSWIPESVWSPRHPGQPPRSPTKARDDGARSDVAQSPTSRHEKEHDDDESYPMSPVSPVLSSRTQRVVNELDNIEVEGILHLLVFLSVRPF